MGNRKETSEVEIKMTTAEAEARIKELGKSFTDATTRLAAMGKDDTGRQKLKAEINAITKEVADLNKSIKKDLTLIIDGKAADGNIRELKAAQMQLTREVESFRDKTDPIYKYKAEQLALVSTRLKELQAPIIDAKKGFINLGEEGSMAQLTAKAKHLKDEIFLLSPAAEEAKQKLAQLEVVENMIKENTAAVSGLKGAFTEIGQIGSITHLEAQAESLRLELSQLRIGTDEWIEKSKSISQIEIKIDEAKAAAKAYKEELIGLGASGSFEQLTAKAAKLEAEIKKLAPETQAFINKTAELQNVTKQIDNLNTKIKGTGGLWNSLTDSVKQFGIIAAGYLGFQALSSQVTNIIRKNADLSDSLANVRQTTGLTADEINNLNKELSRFDTRTAKADLLEIAQVGGQFGIAKEDILAFTESINQATVVLKSEFKGGAQEITSTLAGLRNVLTDIKTGDISTDLRKLGNGLIVLAQQGNATAPVVSDIANRIGGIGRVVGLSTGQILGLSASLQELNINSERGGTAITRLLQKMTTNTAEFAKIAGVPIQEFRRLVNEDVYTAFVKFLDGTKQFKGDALAMGGALKELETTGAGVSEVMAKLGQNTELLGQKVDTASEAIQKTDAITEQYNIKNNTLGAELDKLGKRIYGVFSNDTVNKFFSNAVSGTNRFLDGLKALPEFLQRNTNAIIVLGTATAIYYSRLIAVTAATALSTTATLLWRGVLLGTSAVVSVFNGVIILLDAALLAATGRMAQARVAMSYLNTAMLANPAGLVVAAFAALAGAVALYANNTKAALEVERQAHDYKVLLRDINNTLAPSNIELSQSQAAINDQVEKFNSLSTSQRDALREQIIAQQTLLEIKIADAEAQKQEIINQESKLTYWEGLKLTAGNFFNTTAAAQSKYTAEVQKTSDVEANHAHDLDQLNSAYDATNTALKKFTENSNAETDALKLVTVTTDQYEAKLQKLRYALGGAIIGSEDYQRIQKEIAKTEKEFSQLKGPAAGGPDKAQLDKVRDYNEQMNALYETLNNIRVALVKDAGEKELLELDSRYASQIAKTEEGLQKILDDEKLSGDQKAAYKRENNKVLLALENQYINDRQKLQFKFSQDLTDAELETDIENLTEWAAKRKLALTNELNDEKITREEYEQAVSDLDLKFKQRSVALEEQYYTTSLNNLESATNAAKAELVRRYTSGEITEEQFAQKSKELEGDTSDAKAAIVKNYDAKILAGKQALADAEAGIDTDSIQKFTNREREKLQLQLSTVKDASREQLQLQKEQIERERQQKLEYYKNDAEMRVLINADADHQIELAAQEHLGKLLSQVESLYSNFKSVVGNYFNYLNVKENNELGRDKQVNDKKKANLKAQLDGKKIEQVEYDAQIAKLNEEQAKKSAALRKQQFERDRAAAIINAVISAALAAVQAWNTAKGNPYIYAALAALISASATAEIAVIASQEAPEFETGKRAFVWPGKGGKPEGPSHKDGGIDLVDTSTKQVIGNMEGEEPILSKKTYLNNRPLVDKLLDSSLNKDGEKIKLTDRDILTLFEKGGFLYPPEAETKQEQNVFENYLNSLGAVMALQIPPEAKSALIEKLSVITNAQDEKTRFNEVFKLQQYTQTIAGARNQFSDLDGSISSTLENFGLQVRLLANTTAGKTQRGLVNIFESADRPGGAPGAPDPLDQRGLVNFGSTQNREEMDIPSKKQANPGRPGDGNAGGGSGGSGDPLDQRGLVNKGGLNRGGGIPDPGPSDPMDQRGLVNFEGALNRGGIGDPGPKDPLDQRGLVNFGSAQNREEMEIPSKKQANPGRPGTGGDSYIDQLLRSTAIPSFTSVPSFTSTPVPQLNTGRILENLAIDRHGYAATTGQVNPPVRQEPNNSQRITTDPFQQEMLKALETNNQLLQKSLYFWENHGPFEAQVSLQDFKRKKRLDEQVRTNSQVG